MNSRPFGASDRKVSEVGLGTWQLGGDWGQISDESALSILRAAYDDGTDLLDTADVYGAGRSELLIGRFLKETKAPIFVATKLGRFSPPGWPGNFERAGVREHTEASLKRLGVEALDLTQLHCVPTDVLRRGDIFEHLRELQREGKIRAFGASVESVEEGEICLEQEGVASLQIIFSLLRQKALDRLLPLAKEKQVSILVRLPLASGLLGGKMTKQTTFAPQDHRTYNRNGEKFNVGETFSGLPFEKGVELADALKAYIPAGLTLPQLALRWCLDQEAVTAIIPGATTAAQAKANAAVSALPPLPKGLHAQLADFYKLYVAPNIRGPV
ncbi:MAG TPA: aldo/keto reductase [Opitutaceae bacterium]|jgi:aryl-alcohol dehydrogenase-like predicted oxidoreductase